MKYIEPMVKIIHVEGSDKMDPISNILKLSGQTR